MEQLFKHLSSYGPLSGEARAALAAAFSEQVFARNAYLLREGMICRRLYFLEQGALRGYYNEAGKEVTHWFAFESSFVTSFHSFITRQPAVEQLQFLEGSIVWSIGKETLDSLMDEYRDIERLLRIIYEQYYIRLEQRYVHARFKTAAERYQDLVLQYPHIPERVALGHIASYLGMSQETLSRIRRPS